jgi:hypothetical protein
MSSLAIIEHEQAVVTEVPSLLEIWFVFDAARREGHVGAITPIT